MALGVIGDIHGKIKVFHDIVEETKPYDDVKAVIQVGDLGIAPHDIRWAEKHDIVFAKPTYFVDGNHEFFEVFYDNKVVTEIIPNLFYVPRGTVMELDNRRVAFLGGAASIDKNIRLQNGYHWDNRENITPEEVQRLYDNVGDQKVDLFITHAPPISVVEAHFDPLDKLGFGVPANWVDHNTEIVEQAWHKFGKCPLVCGHMHRSLQFQHDCRILDIYEFRTV